MKSKLINKLVLAILMLMPLAVSAQEYSVIVHPSNEAAFDSEEVKRIFLVKQKTFSNGKQALPVSIKPPSDKRDAFHSKILEKTDSQLRTYWAMLVFSGKAVPAKEVENEREVVELVATNPNVIGYVSSSAVNEQVKQVLNF